MRNCLGSFLLAGIAAVALSSALHAQTAQQPGSAKPAAASAPAPAHDLSGVWNMHSTPAQRKYTGNTYTAEPPEMTPWGTEKYMATKPSNGPRTHPLKETDDPVLRQCLPPGTPRIYLQPFPFQMVQAAKEIIMIYEYDHTVRQIFTDGRPHPEDITPTYMGHSIGKWEGDTLVVDTVGFNEKIWIMGSYPSTEQLHLTERISRPTLGSLEYEVIIDDPGAYTATWNARGVINETMAAGFVPNGEMFEYICEDDR